VLVRPADEARISEAIFRHTTTLGLRRRDTTRWSLERTEIVVNLRGQDVRVKIGTLGPDVVNVAPEFQDCVDVAEQTGAAVKDVYADAASAARLQMSAAL
jgi:hypothetical protein